MSNSEIVKTLKAAADVLRARRASKVKAAHGPVELSNIANDLTDEAVGQKDHSKAAVLHMRAAKAHSEAAKAHAHGAPGSSASSRQYHADQVQFHQRNVKYHNSQGASASLAPDAEALLRKVASAGDEGLALADMEYPQVARDLEASGLLERQRRTGWDETEDGTRTTVDEPVLVLTPQGQQALGGGQEVPAATGAWTISQRQESAFKRLVAHMTEALQCSDEDATALAKAYVKNKLVKLDAASGQFEAKHGSFLDKSTMQRALTNLKGNPKLKASLSDAERWGKPSFTIKTTRGKADVHLDMAGYGIIVLDSAYSPRDSIAELTQQLEEHLTADHLKVHIDEPHNKDWIKATRPPFTGMLVMPFHKQFVSNGPRKKK
jgi:hypothetical protein